VEALPEPAGIPVEAAIAEVSMPVEAAAETAPVGEVPAMVAPAADIAAAPATSGVDSVEAEEEDEEEGESVAGKKKAKKKGKRKDRTLVFDETLGRVVAVKERKSQRSKDFWGEDV
jgi:hypothetical protein